jgi:hypothetical protein
MAAWPGTLPQRPKIQGYNESLPDVLLRSEVSSGEAKSRPRATSNVRTLKVQWLFESLAQRTTFITFFTVTIKGGSLAFQMEDPLDGTLLNFRFRQVPTIRALSDTAFEVDGLLEEML